MKVVIIGGGASGAAIEAACREVGLDASLRSRATGFDVTSSQPPELDADVVVEATNTAATSRGACVEFFTRSTRSVATAARRAGARHVLLSIVNAHLPEVQGFGYFAGKTAQERLARRLSPGLGLVRTTQWFEFGTQTLRRSRVGPFGLVPPMRVQPMALRAAARVVAEVAAGVRDEELVEVGGPEPMTLWELVRRSPGPGGVVPVPVPLPTTYGRAFRRGALLPGTDVELVGPTLAAWAAAR